VSEANDLEARGATPVNPRRVRNDTQERAYQQVEVTSAVELREWLQANHDKSPGIWLVSYKKAAGDKYLSYEDLVCEALCWGWIDSKAKSLDELRSQLLLTPRKPASKWSRPNKIRIAQLEAAGRMRAPGRAVVEAAKASGTWTALDDVENLIEPAELKAALDASPVARKNWDAFPRSVRRATLEWIAAAKRAETRERRIVETVDLAAQNLRRT
jgi:uncharacterized protein YdeI (YjbR/CyaY-like superfamily)